MTIGTFTLISLTGSLVVLKLAFMAFALTLLARHLFPARPALARVRQPQFGKLKG